ncbi:MAG: hypothetical protein ACOCRX_08645 [Candidatus Woesearchaeota archaeon]
MFTKMGCEFLANKFTGEKGILFTALSILPFSRILLALFVNSSCTSINNFVKQTILLFLSNPQGSIFIPILRHF